jgi:hypothetical protein
MENMVWRVGCKNQIKKGTMVMKPGWQKKCNMDLGKWSPSLVTRVSNM